MIDFLPLQALFDLVLEYGNAETEYHFFFSNILNQNNLLNLDKRENLSSQAEYIPAYITCDIWPDFVNAWHELNHKTLIINVH